MEKSTEEKQRISKVIEHTAKMRAVSKDLKTIANEIVKKSKETAKVDTGLLKRSISYVVNLDGIITFTQFHYGELDGNSQLVENIKKMFPENEPYIYCTQGKDGSQRVVFTKSIANPDTKESFEAKGIQSFITRLKNMMK